MTLLVALLKVNNVVTIENQHDESGEVFVRLFHHGASQPLDLLPEPGCGHVLAASSEEGKIHVYDTEWPRRRSAVLLEWLAHSNAVFDLAWMPGEAKLVTASGDQTARLWDVNTRENLGSFKGHHCSLRSVAFSKHDKAMLCTGGRDGNIMLWDIRCTKKEGFYTAVKKIPNAHGHVLRSGPTGKRRAHVRGLAPSVDSQQSVTAVIFQDERTLISAGAVDGVVKMWDLRKYYSTSRCEPVPMHSFPYAGSSSRKHGYSSLVLDSTGSYLFATCMDDCIYMFSTVNLNTTPVCTFQGHRNASFYVKASLSPDDRYLLSGSSDGKAYIWKVHAARQPPVLMCGHAEEVTAVCWCPTDFSKIVTCSDDDTLRVWSMLGGPRQEESLVKRSLGFLGWTSHQESAISPAAPKPRTPVLMPLPQHTSPRAAICASSTLPAMPSPSSSESSIQSTIAVSASHQPAIKSSIFPQAQKIDGLDSSQVMNASPGTLTHWLRIRSPQCSAVAWETSSVGLEARAQRSSGPRRAKRRLQTSAGNAETFEAGSRSENLSYNDLGIPACKKIRPHEEESIDEEKLQRSGEGVGFCDGAVWVTGSSEDASNVLAKQHDARVCEENVEQEGCSSNEFTSLSPSSAAHSSTTNGTSKLLQVHHVAANKENAVNRSPTSNWLIQMGAKLKEDVSRRSPRGVVLQKSHLSKTRKPKEPSDHVGESATRSNLSPASMKNISSYFSKC
uniref:Denticleless E3 ubiquitin protein ligase homolog (Drosophila) n=2 Tax=Eptatretus burgeri TaxID=7764 RepID=A0A8C4QJL2_EPTBU